MVNNTKVGGSRKSKTRNSLGSSGLRRRTGSAERIVLESECGTYKVVNATKSKLQVYGLLCKHS